MTVPEWRDALGREAQRWLGTPFRAHTGICGVGADCVHLVHGILVGAGRALPPITNLDYPLDWAMHQRRSLVLEWLEGSGFFVRLAAADRFAPGDVLCVRQGRCSHHVALQIDGRQFIHTQPGRFAELGLVDDPTYALPNLLDARYRHTALLDL